MTARRPVVLISDDEPLVVAAFAREARRVGMDTVTDTTSDVVTLARKHQPDVILLDMRQRIDGRDLLQRLKHDPETCDLKVIVLSAVEDQFMRRVCLELGAEDYAVKPFDPAFLHRVARIAASSSNFMGSSTAA
ncbi:MAG: response regulator [Archangium sp.]|nr:response regulator [Archangium sp.]